MPRAASAEPLVMVLAPGGFPNPEGEIVAGVGTAWTGVQTFQPTRVCLGPGDYAPATTTGRGVAMPIAAMPAGACNMPSGLGDLDIEPATPEDGCPQLGTVPNGSFELGQAPWSLSASTTGASAAIAQTSSSNHALELGVFDNCTDADASEVVSVLTSASSPTLALTETTTPGADLFVILGGGFLSGGLAIAGTGAQTSHTFCIPAGLAGVDAPLDLSLQEDVNGAACGSASASWQSVIDDIAIGEDPSCGSDPGVADPGFESPRELYGADPPPGGSVAKVYDPTQAHTGSASLLITNSIVCDDAQYEPLIVVPPPSATGGPALTYFYRTELVGAAQFQAFPAASAPPITDGAWHQAIACLDPAQVGRPIDTDFVVIDDKAGAIRGTGDGLSSAWLDDLAVTTTPSCPSQ